MLLPFQSLEFTELPLEAFEQKQVQVTVARLDKLHPVVSGNKLYKLYYFLEDCKTTPHQRIVTFGGAHSNHLVATAYAARQLGLHAIGIVRGERPPVLSHTLESCLQYGMQLEFVSRADYKILQAPASQSGLLQRFGECIIVPEGGYSSKGAAGASLIMQDDQMSVATHVCTAVGTATTLGGILKAAGAGQEIIAIPVLKGMTDIPDRINYLVGNDYLGKLSIVDHYHFGGYAKHTPELVEFMNELYREAELPTDFVYTAKMMFAVFDKIQKGYFPAGSKIACVHTGGLQGNATLPPGTIIF
jgi:1-aminocyclopropane-1-carboxylate deaminase/D-cysteine desulfhydrase-like pyridoxal-dependent ACC family enzyme